MSLKDIVRSYILRNGLPGQGDLLEVRGYLAAVEDCVFAGGAGVAERGIPDAFEREPTDGVLVPERYSFDAVGQPDPGLAYVKSVIEDLGVRVAATERAAAELYESQYTWEEAKAFAPEAIRVSIRGFIPEGKLGQDGTRSAAVPPANAVLIGLAADNTYPPETVAYLDPRFFSADVASQLGQAYIGDIVAAQKAPYVQSTQAPEAPMAPPTPRAPRAPAKPKLMPPVDPDARAAQRAATARLVAQDKARVTRRFKASTSLLSERHE